MKVHRPDQPLSCGKKSKTTYRTATRLRNSICRMMMTTTTKRTKIWKSNKLRVATWNAKNREMVDELTENKIEICSASKRKKKIKERYMNRYTLIYNRVPREQRAQSGVRLLRYRKYKEQIESENYVSNRILQLTISINQEVIKYNNLCIMGD